MNKILMFLTKASFLLANTGVGIAMLWLVFHSEKYAKMELRFVAAMAALVTALLVLISLIPRRKEQSSTDLSQKAEDDESTVDTGDDLPERMPIPTDEIDAAIAEEDSLAMDFLGSGDDEAILTQLDMEEDLLAMRGETEQEEPARLTPWQRLVEWASNRFFHTEKLYEDEQPIESHYPPEALQPPLIHAVPEPEQIEEEDPDGTDDDPPPSKKPEDPPAVDEPTDQPAVVKPVQGTDIKPAGSKATDISPPTSRLRSVSSGTGSNADVLDFTGKWHGDDKPGTN